MRVRRTPSAARAGGARAKSLTSRRAGLETGAGAVKERFPGALGLAGEREDAVQGMLEIGIYLRRRRFGVCRLVGPHAAGEAYGADRQHRPEDAAGGQADDGAYYCRYGDD